MNTRASKWFGPYLNAAFMYCPGLKYIGCARFSWAQVRQHNFGRRPAIAGKGREITVNAFTMTNSIRTKVREKCEDLSGAGLRAVGGVTVSRAASLSPWLSAAFPGD